MLSRLLHQIDTDIEYTLVKLRSAIVFGAFPQLFVGEGSVRATGLVASLFNKIMINSAQIRLLTEFDTLL